MTLVLGVDIGGTASRALVTTLDGVPVGFGRSGAGNPVTVPPAEAAANISAALEAALAGVDHAEIGAAVAGAAGSSRPAVIESACRDAGVRCQLRIVGDVVVAFAAGTAQERGTVLISGTGAVAADVHGDRVLRVADGLGWLLGDLGSGFWLGRAAVTTTVQALQREDPPTPLLRMVTAAIGETEPDPLVAAVYQRPPRELAALAPLVTRAALDGDAYAVTILDRAAGHLHDSVAELRAPGEESPIVLAGGVLRHCPPLLATLRQRLAASWPAAPAQLAEAGEVGAARLAARALTGRPSSP